MLPPTHTEEASFCHWGPSLGALGHPISISVFLQPPFAIWHPTSPSLRSSNTRKDRKIVMWPFHKEWLVCKNPTPPLRKCMNTKPHKRLWLMLGRSDRQIWIDFSNLTAKKCISESLSQYVLYSCHPKRKHRVFMRKHYGSSNQMWVTEFASENATVCILLFPGY